MKNLFVYELLSPTGPVTLADFAKDYLVVYFYPKDSTPGCTLEGRDFSKLSADFKKLKTAVVGISGGTAASKQKFASVCKITVPLLADPDFTLAKKLKVYGEKKFMGRSYQGITRSTFIFDEAGNLIKSYPNVKALGHAKTVLTDLSKLQND